MIYVNAREYKEKMSKFQIGDKVVCVRNTPAVQEGWVGYVKELDMLVRPLDYMAESEDGNGTFAFYEWELELLEHAKKECQVEEGDICLVSEEAEKLFGSKEVCVVGLDKVNNGVRVCKWPRDEELGFHLSVNIPISHIEMVLFNRFDESNKTPCNGQTATEQAVHSPKHYSVFDGIEAIEIIASSLTQAEFRGYCFGNLLKYRLRVGKKDNIEQELGKADKYQELFDKFKYLCKGEA